MRKFAPVLLVATAVSLFGCGVKERKTSHSTAQEMVDDVTYAQSKVTKLCFAVTSKSRTIQQSDYAIGVTQVPCTAEVLAQIKG